MIQKKIKSILAIGIMLVSLAVVAVVPTAAEGFHSVYGYLYINDNPAPSDVEVKITFDDGVETDLTDADGYYQIDFTGPSHEWPKPGGFGYFSVIYNGKNYIPTDNKSVKILSGIIGFNKDLHLDEDTGGNGGNGGNGGGGSPTRPTADASGPYYGALEDGVAEVTFDGSGSSGTITSYSWDFGDGRTGTGVSPTHEYSALGNYTANLTVTGPGGSDTDQTFVVIGEELNVPPTAPVVSGPQSGSKNTDYSYSAVSTDADNDTIQYTFDWGDGTNSITDFVGNVTAVTEAHNWSNWGIYTVKVKAYDNKTVSVWSKYVVLIDVHWVKNIGYLIDTDSDETTYDKFYSNETGSQTVPEKLENGSYKINSDIDAEWDYIYDPDTDTLTAYGAPSEPEEEEDYTWLYALIIVIIILLILIAAVGKKKKPKGKPKKPKK